MKVFIAVFSILVLAIGYTIGQYLISSIVLFQNYQVLFWLVHLFLISTMISAPMIYRIYPIKHKNIIYDAFQWLSYISMGFYFVLLGFVFLNVVGITTIINFAIADEIQQNYIRVSLAYFALGISIVITIVGIYTARKNPKVVNISIPIKDLPKSFDGLKIVQLSDVHVGQTIKASFVKTIVDMTNNLNPDLIFLTGDFVDGSPLQLLDDVDYFKNLKSTLGIFYIPGNHEYYWGLEAWVNIFKSLGFTTLLNQHAIIIKNNDELLIAGVHDYSAHRINSNYTSSVKVALEGAPLEIKKILLAHQPQNAYEASELGIDVQFSGHTHAGQFFPSNILIYFFQPFVKGLCRYKNLWIYVNPGTGYWGPPNRLGVNSEITLIELKRS